MFAYTHPLINQGAGRIKTDPQNQSRIQRILHNYQKWSANNNQSSHKQLPITKQQVNKAKIIFPLVGLLTGIIGSATFVHKNSKYIGKIFTSGLVGIGYLFGQRYIQSHNTLRYCWNYYSYPNEIQKMIDNNDARYAHAWLKEEIV